MAEADVIAAVVPVAFFTREHLHMTDAFLNRLQDEVDRVGVWFNGGDEAVAAEGLMMLKGHDVEVHDAVGWRFFRMWNAGTAWAAEIGADVALVLNNDIEWQDGALRMLGEALNGASPDVAVASPDPMSDTISPTALQDIEATPAYRGLLGWCFAVRPTMWQQIDERYYCWWGDDEIGNLMHEAGWRCVRAMGIPVQHPVNESTFRYRDDLWEMRRADEALYNSKWS